jgi:hypothetical protein
LVAEWGDSVKRSINPFSLPSPFTAAEPHRPDGTAQTFGRKTKQVYASNRRWGIAKVDQSMPIFDQAWV